MLHLAKNIRLIMPGAILVLLLATPAAAEFIYTATLDGATAGTASAATGSATLTLNDARTEVSYLVEFTGLEGTETGAHIHNGAPGVLGPRFHTFASGSPKIGTWAVDAFALAELEAGRVYINIHSEAYPGGELRGEIEFSSVANDAVSWGSLKALYE